MDPKTRLRICHHNRLFRECLTSALAEVNQMDITIMDDSFPDTSLASRLEGYDLLLIDACLPDQGAFRLVQMLRTSDQRPRTILLVSAASPELIESCLQAGADGCVLDDDTLDDLRQAIENVRSGRSYCSPQVAHRLFTQVRGIAPQGSRSARANECLLTRREVEILRLIAKQNLSNKQIARELRISVYTVKNHVHSIIEKLSVEDRQTAVRHALRQGLLGDSIA
jgi:DNA-binding NarL/FixJ family response regulator